MPRCMMHVARESPRITHSLPPMTVPFFSDAALLLASARTLVDSRRETEEPCVVDGPRGRWRLKCVRRYHTKAKVGSRPAFSRTFVPPVHCGFRLTHSYRKLEDMITSVCGRVSPQEIDAAARFLSRPP